MCKLLGIKCHILDRTAIENYFTQRAIDLALGREKFVAFPGYGLGTGQRWSKNWNWRIARSLQKSEVEATDLGQFLASA